MIFDVKATSALLAKDEDFIKHTISFSDFIYIKSIFCLITTATGHRMAFIGSIPQGTCSIIDPANSDNSSQANQYGHILTELFNSFLRSPKLKLSVHTQTVQKEETCLDCGPIICSVILNIIQNSPNRPWDIRSLRYELKKVNGHQLRQPETPTSKIRKHSISFRKQAASDLLRSVWMACTQMAADKIYEHILQLRSDRTLPRNIRHDPKLPERDLNCENIRRSYLKDKKGTIQKILYASTITDFPSEETIVSHFIKKGNPPKPVNWTGSFPTIQGSEFQFHSPSAEEILKCVKDLKHSAAGEDTIYYRDVLYADPEGKLMEFLFSKVVESCTAPTQWVRFKTLLIPKKDKDGSYNNIDSWRPIALLSSVYKILTSCLAHQLQSWIKAERLLHPFQKNMGPYEGCAEHNFTLTSILEYQRRNQILPIHVAFLDICEAFPTVPVELICVNLRKMGCQEKSTALIEALYANSECAYICGSIKTAYLPIRTGVRQGCPLSMLLFSIGINPLLMELSNELSFGYSLHQQKVAVLAYADDLALIAQTQNWLQHMIQCAEVFAERINITFNPKKCGYLSHNHKHAQNLTIHDQPIPIIENGLSYKYLGVNFSKRGKIPPIELMQACILDLSKIESSNLLPWQKLDAYHIFIHSRLTFIFRNVEFPIGFLNHYMLPDPRNPAKMTHLEAVIRDFIRKVTFSNRNCPTAYMYTEKSMGGIGLLPVTEEYCIQSIVQAFKMLVAEHNALAHIAEMELIKTAENSTNLSSALDWLNAGSQRNPNSSWWHRVRYAIGHLASACQICVTFTPVPDINIKVRHTPEPSNITHKEVIISRENKQNLTHALHDLLRRANLFNWRKMKRHGECSMALALSPLVNTAIFNRLSLYAWRFIHRARTNCLPTRDAPENENKSCRRCDYHNESLQHVLCHCPANMHLVRNRHNAILRLIAEALSKLPDIECVFDQQCKLSDRNLRPDIQVTCDSAKAFYIIDVKTPYDTVTNFDNAASRNMQHYKELQSDIRSALSGWRVHIYTVIVGALGSWAPANDSVLKELGLRDSTVNSLRSQCVISSTEISAMIWNSHNHGHRYLLKAADNPSDS